MTIGQKIIKITIAALVLHCSAIYAGEIHYYYDGASRLSRTEHLGSMALDYTYDNIGNRADRQISANSTPSNRPPNVPANPTPIDLAPAVLSGGNLVWAGGDPDADDLVLYDVYFGTDASPPLVSNGVNGNEFAPGRLHSFTTYHWKIVAKDSRNAVTSGPIWSFTTANTPPWPPENFLPVDQTQIGYLNTSLNWSCQGDENPNDSVIFDLYFGTSAQPPLLVSNHDSTNFVARNLTPNIPYFWKVVSKDNHGAETPGPVFTFIIADSDNDGMPDQWEIDFGFDPFTDDAAGDADNDGVSNLIECIHNTDPLDGESAPSDLVEDFETGDLHKFFWVSAGNMPWQVAGSKPYLGAFAGETPALSDGMNSSLETTFFTEAGSIHFFYAVSSEANGDILSFYIDGVLKGEWSGEIPYSLASYDVTAGQHDFKWVYQKNAASAAGQDKAWIDNIVFPGASDSDGDGVIDGWEYHFFGRLDQDMCLDSDGDGLKDIEEAAAHTDPTLTDTDGDGIPDAWETTHGLDPLIDDAFTDADSDGIPNYDEFMGDSDPNNPESRPFAAFEDFETGDLTRFYWITSGDGQWEVSQDKPYMEAFSAKAPLIGDDQAASIETTIECRNGRIRFFVSTASEADADVLNFYIDNVPAGVWSGDTSYQEAIFDVTAGRHTFKWTYAKNGANALFEDTAWIDNISFPGSGDSDNDGVTDGWEFAHFNTLNQNLCLDSDGDGLKDIEEAEAKTDPFNPDTDGDGITDAWEVRNGLDSLVDDAFADFDGDGIPNYDEFMGDSDPNNPESRPFAAFEDFETGDLTRFYWITSGDGQWEVSQDKPYLEAFSAKAPLIGDDQAASIETTIECRNGRIRFFVSTASEADADVLNFYIDSVPAGAWSGDTPYQEAIFDVTAGRHTFKWTYAKNGANALFEDTAWIDNISFPGSGDSDNDGVTDGWEFAYFNTLNQDLCLDSDGDGLRDIEEAEAKTDPFNPDTDGDGITDTWEVKNGLDSLVDDAFADFDGDGISNYDEFMGSSDPNKPESRPFAAFEGFETGDLTRFYWIISGDGQWEVSQDKPYMETFSAQAPLIGDNQSASLETTIECMAGRIRFFVSTASEANGDVLHFYIDDSLVAEWSGDVPYQEAIFDVTAGRHIFKWTYAKNGANAEFEDTAWIDNISFPGSGDSDNDGAADGWEFVHFNTLNQDLCTDSDLDGVTDLEEATKFTNPFSPDTDADGLNDGAEMIYETDPHDPDTDDDTYMDGEEVNAGSDPLDAASIPAISAVNHRITRLAMLLAVPFLLLTVKGLSSHRKVG